MWTRIIRYAELPLTPWKNGGGVTRELYVCRSGQGEPQWRLSMALVESSGPFSAYPGVNRVLAVVRGDPLRLQVDGAAHLLLPLQPFSFSGDALSSGELTGSAIEDFNVMAWGGLVPTVQIGPAQALDLTGAQAVVVLAGEVTLQSPGQKVHQKVQLNYGDTALLDETPTAAAGSGQLAAVRLTEPGKKAKQTHG